MSDNTGLFENTDLSDNTVLLENTNLSDNTDRIIKLQFHRRL